MPRSLNPAPPWYARVSPNPDYDNARIILLDSNLFFAACNEDGWDDELAWVLNSPAVEIRVKINAAIRWEVVRGGTTVPPDVRRAQIAFVDVYRRSGKIVVDEGAVPFFATRRLHVFGTVDGLLRDTRNLSEMDRRIVVDGIVNRIPILSRDDRMKAGLESALRNQRLAAALRANGLPTNPRDIIL